MKRENPDGSEKEAHIIYKEEFRRQAVEMVIHSGKTQAQVRPMLGFKRFETAAVTIRGIELAEKIKKHQFNLKPLTGKATTRSGNVGRGPGRLKSAKPSRQTKTYI